jgi:hypothetical protein
VFEQRTNVILKVNISKNVIGVFPIMAHFGNDFFSSNFVANENFSCVVNSEGIYLLDQSEFKHLNVGVVVSFIVIIGT